MLPEHIDALDHTNNTQYVNWCNEAAWAHTLTGFGAEAYKSLDRAMAAIAGTNICKPLASGELEVGTWITT